MRLILLRGQRQEIESTVSMDGRNNNEAAN